MNIFAQMNIRLFKQDQIKNLFQNNNKLEIYYYYFKLPIKKKIYKNKLINYQKIIK